MDQNPERREGERRRVPRQKSFLRGQIFFNNRRNAVDCLVRDISPHGARLIFSTSVTIPDVLDLHIPQKDQTVRIHVIWRSGYEVGVEFPQASHGEPSAEGGDVSERLRRLEAEVATLKKIIKRMKADTDPDSEVA